LPLLRRSVPFSGYCYYGWPSSSWNDLLAISALTEVNVSDSRVPPATDTLLQGWPSISSMPLLLVVPGLVGTSQRTYLGVLLPLGEIFFFPPSSPERRPPHARTLLNKVFPLIPLHFWCFSCCVLGSFAFDVQALSPFFPTSRRFSSSCVFLCLDVPLYIEGEFDLITSARQWSAFFLNAFRRCVPCPLDPARFSSRLLRTVIFRVSFSITKLLMGFLKHVTSEILLTLTFLLISDNFFSGL